MSACAVVKELTLPVNERAGQPASQADLVDVAKLVTSYYALHPDPAVPEQRVASARRATAARRCAARSTRITSPPPPRPSATTGPRAGTTGPLFLGRDTHALSEPAFVTALEVLAANEVTVLVDSRDGYTPTPALSRAILTYNDGPRPAAWPTGS